MEKILVKCPECGKEYCQKGINSHIWRMHGQGRNHNPNSGYQKGTRIVWNKGLTQQTDSRVKKNIDSLKNGYNSGRNTPSMLGKHLSEQSKQKIRQKMFGNNRGGKCKWYTFVKSNGISFKVQGTYQLRFARVLQILDPDWVKIGVGDKEHRIQWCDQAKVMHYYTPDFYSPLLNQYYEVKGRWWGNDQFKMKQVIDCNKDKIIQIVLEQHLVHYQKQTNLQKFNISQYDLEPGTKRTAKQYQLERIEKRTELQNENIQRVIDSDIDYSKRGWSRQISTLIGIRRQKVSQWCKRFIPQYYETIIKGARV